MNERTDTFEGNLRDLLAQDAGALAPGSAPYAAIVRQGRTERRRAATTVVAAAAALVLVPVGAYALTGLPGDGAGTAAPVAVAPATSAPPRPVVHGPAGPATPGQLADGITLAQASDGLTRCLTGRFAANAVKDGVPGGYGDPDDYRILLALRSTGDDNAPGDGIHVVAVRDKGPKGPRSRVTCTLKKGKADGINASMGVDEPGALPVVPDINAQQLYRQAILSSPGYRLPFRWGAIGTVAPSVARVTVSYEGPAVEAALDRGWFAATGVLTVQPRHAPHVLGYDVTGKQVYDSDRDPSYDKAL
ncbi:hypothetical protein [Streptomyces sp. NPDC089919]|uniref:hypothetical protein n=1 Tax=Streptomyces sp. NPDC089919 TaxID=3155188 RepID=UPI003428AA39